jgi:hypothetical protein
MAENFYWQEFFSTYAKAPAGQVPLFSRSTIEFNGF